MVSSDSSSSPFVSLSLVALIVAIGGGVLWKGGKLDPDRPPPLEAVERTVRDEQWIEAHPAEDPIRAVGLDKKALKGTSQRGMDPWLEFAAHLQKASAQSGTEKVPVLAAMVTSGDTAEKVPVLAVMVTSGDTAEKVERRRRTRIAVISALAVSGFVPVNPGALGVLPFPTDSSSGTDGDRNDDDGRRPRSGEQQALRSSAQRYSTDVDGNTSGDDSEALAQNLIPFEWFRHDALSEATARRRSEAPWKGDVAVLWLEESLFGDQPLFNLGQIKHRLASKLREIGYSREKDTRIGTPRFDLKVIGPASSDALSFILDEEMPPKRRVEYRLETIVTQLIARVDEGLAIEDTEFQAGEKPPGVLGTATGDRYRVSATEAVRDYQDAVSRLNSAGPEWTSILSDRLLHALPKELDEEFQRQFVDYWVSASAELEEQIADPGLIDDRDSAIEYLVSMLTDDLNADLETAFADPEVLGLQIQSNLKGIEFVDSESEEKDGKEEDSLRLKTDWGSDAIRKVVGKLLGPWNKTVLERSLANTLVKLRRGESRSSTVDRVLVALNRDGFLNTINKTDSPCFPSDLNGRREWRGQDLRWARELAEDLGGVEMYSPRATAASPLVLVDQRRRENGRIASLVEVLGERGVRFVPGNLTDDVLAERLVDELELRGVNLSENADHVVLISEWDTFYGRALPLTFSAAVERRRRGRNRHLYSNVLAELVDEGDGLPSGIEVYGYLRGIDGERARRKSNATGGEKEPDQNAAGSLNRQPSAYENPALGVAQLDYISRLGKTMQARHREFVENGGRGIRAIGILGSDVYDKLLVLQALRDEFPNAVFFTTDLDARLLEPSRYEWTRNLVIASAFGLEVGNHLHRGLVPPFRDSYQTATFVTCLTALGRFAEDDLADELRPRVFEVGRTGAVDLSRASDDSFLSVRPRRIPPASAIVAPVAMLFGGAFLLLLTFSPLLKRHAFRLESPNGQNTKDSTAAPKLTEADQEATKSWLSEQRALLIVFVGGALATSLMVMLARNANSDGVGEPFALFEGVSAWPTEMMRLLAILVAVLLFVEGYFEIRRSNREISARFDLKMPSKKIRKGETDQDRILRSRAGVLQRAKALCRLPASCGGKCGSEDPRAPVIARAGHEFHCLWDVVCHDRTGSWRLDDENLENTSDEADDGKNGDGANNQNGGIEERKIVAKRLWQQYVGRGALGATVWRVIPHIILYMVFGFLLMNYFGHPALPLRGSLAFKVDTIVLAVAVLLVVSITFFVVDAILLCERFSRLLFSGNGIKWPKGAARVGRLWRRQPDSMGPVEDAVGIQLVAMRTQCIGRLILYPFIVAFLMIVSRHELFDNWNWPPSLLVVIGLILVISLISTIVLRRSAEAGRRETVQRLRDEILATYGGGSEEADGVDQDKKEAESEDQSEQLKNQGTDDADDETKRVEPKARIEQLKILMDEVRQMRTGALSPITEHPIIAAILMPFGGVGVLALIELLVNS